MSGAQPIRTDFAAGFQVKFILAICTGALLTTIAIYFYLDQGLGSNYFDALVTLSTVESALSSSLVITFCLQLLLLFLLTLGLTLFVSHKIAGPVFRYEECLDNIINGDLRTDVRTRNGDQLKPMVDSMNLWQNALRDTYVHANQLERELLSLASRSPSSPVGDCTELRSAAERLANSLNPTPDKGREGHE